MSEEPGGPRGRDKGTEESAILRAAFRLGKRIGALPQGAQQDVLRSVMENVAWGVLG